MVDRPSAERTGSRAEQIQQLYADAESRAGDAMEGLVASNGFAELLSLQQRTAAAIAVLDDATEVAREMGGGVLSPEILKRRDELLRRAAGS